MKSSTLILITTLLFILSAGTISFLVERELDPNYEKDWFAIGFITLESDTPDFIIENHSSEESYRYTIQSKGEILVDTPFSVKKGETLEMHPENMDLETPYMITVFPESDPKRSESLTRK
jgi:hypothetical protein